MGSLRRRLAGDYGAQELKHVLVLAALLGNLVIALVEPNIFSSVLASILFVTSATMMFLADPVAVWIMAPVIMSQLSVLISLNFIEAGGYMVEMGQVGSPSIASATYCIIALLMLWTAFGCRRLLLAWGAALAKARPRVPVHEAKSLHPIFLNGFAAWAVACVLYLFVAGLVHGFPLLMGMDRFVYRRNYADIITINLLDLKFLPSIALGLAFAVAGTRLLRTIYLSSFVTFITLSFLYGDKFFVVLLVVLGFCTASLMSDPTRMVRGLIRLLPVASVVVACMGGVTFIIYSDFGAKDTGATIKKISDRVSSQGELWFVAVQDAPGAVAFDATQVEANIASIAQTNPADFLFLRQIGPFYFIKKYAPEKMYRSFLHNAGTVTPTMVGEAYGLALFGWVGVVLQTFFIGILLAVLVNYLQWSIGRGNPFLVWLPSFVFNQFIKAFAQAAVFSLVSIPIVKSYVAFLVLEGAVVILAHAFARRAPRGRLACRPESGVGAQGRSLMQMPPYA